jgi:hypothetical protein
MLILRNFYFVTGLNPRHRPKFDISSTVAFSRFILRLRQNLRFWRWDKVICESAAYTRFYSFETLIKWERMLPDIRNNTAFLKVPRLSFW